MNVKIDDGGLALPRMGFGCASLMRVVRRRDRMQLLATAFEEGLCHFDVARLYGLGRAEAELGRFARGRRDQITIATKFGLASNPKLERLAGFQAPARALLGKWPGIRAVVRRRGDIAIAPRSYGAGAAQLSLDKSLRNLGVDYVDILLVHDPRPQDAINALELAAVCGDLRRAGKIRAWGVAYDEHPELQLVHDFGPCSVLQMRDSVFRHGAVRAWSGPVVTFGMLATAYGQIRRGLEADAALRGRWSSDLGCDPMHGHTLADLLLTDALVANSRGCVLYSSVSPARVRLASRVARRPVDRDRIERFRDLVARTPFAAGPR